MAEEKIPGTPVKRWVPVLVLVLAVAIAGLYYITVIMPAAGPGPAPENDADTAPGGHNGDVSPDGTNCHGVYNLQEENRDNFGPPTVVDINEANGNLLVRGPLPLIVRDGTDPSQGCRNKADWQFAYDNLNSMILAGKDVSPAYFTPAKKTALNAQMQSFNLSDYHVIDISLLNRGDNSDYFDIENAAFGQKYSMCSDKIADGTLRGQSANLIWSSVGGCSDDASCRIVLYQDAGDLCSYNNLMAEISTLMAQKDPSGKKLLIYFHCTHGADRTGVVTMGYLMNVTGLDYTDALKYTNNLGQETTDHPHPVKDTYYTLATMYCRAIGKCPAAGTPEAGGTSVLPVSTTIVTLVPTPQPTVTAAPVQTAVPTSRYNPAAAGGTQF
ncbi:MAG: hypothetical protein LUQ71_03630 [Methanoregula sp.]|nr:hypothetical protein [Methanoregula sp.]